MSSLGLPGVWEGKMSISTPCTMQTKPFLTHGVIIPGFWDPHQLRGGIYSTIIQSALCSMG